MTRTVGVAMPGTSGRVTRPPRPTRQRPGSRPVRRSLPVMGREAARRPRRKRWGLRTLGFLSLALVSILASNGLAATGHGTFPITLFGTLVGLVGAGYCSYRGLRDCTWLPRG